jgi:hypothetical protein
MTHSSLTATEGPMLHSVSDNMLASQVCCTAQYGALVEWTLMGNGGMCTKFTFVHQKSYIKYYDAELGCLS